MKRAFLISLLILAAHPPALGYAEPPPVTVLLAGGAASNTIHVWLTPDGRTYVIDSIVPLEVGGTLCANAEGNPNELLCQAPAIAGFEVNADGGDDTVSVAKEVKIPVTMRGGSGRDLLIGGSGSDKLLGGSGVDRLIGGHGDDLLVGGPAGDVLIGGTGNDYVQGGPGNDVHVGGPGNDVILTGSGGKDVVRTGEGSDYVRRLRPSAV